MTEKTDIYENIKRAKSGQYRVCIFGAGYLGQRLGREMLSVYGLTADFYCDNNASLWGQNIIDGIFCKSVAELLELKNDVICFLFVPGIYTDEVLKQLETMPYVVSGMELGILEEVRGHYFPFLKRNQIAVYTCIVGEYDDLKEPEYISPNCDYYLVSDNRPPEGSVYKYLDIRDYLPEMELDDTRKNRYIKLHPHKLFPNYRYSIYVDGNVTLIGNIAEKIVELEDKLLLTMSKAYFDTYTEAMRLSRNGMGEPNVIIKQMEQYYLEGMPTECGHWFNGILVRKHNDARCIKLMEDWWTELTTKSRRDQMSFPYVLWKNGYKPSDVGVVSDNPKVMYENDSSYFIWHEKHNRDRKIKEFMKG